ncbi:hypothetical protein [Mycoplasma sp. P36-A1]|uniref:hypothetical protein n=1 Tax=Mycoplasma sp. P36-A1 TaxID=3252900 RepID=UPI003C2D553F
MKTEVLYYNNINEYEFDATVLESTEKDGLFYSILDKTAFYPEGGGMSNDIGTINGIQVEHVMKKDDEIYHVTSQKLEDDVHGIVDMHNRTIMIQGHDSQHLLTALLELDYGFNTISHHVHDNYYDIVLEGDNLTPQIIEQISAKANQLIIDDAVMEIFYIDKTELGKYGLKDNPKYTNPVRITNIVALNDYNACGCLHFESLKKIQSLVILDYENTSKGYKLTYTCGLALVDYFSKMNENMKQVYALTKSNEDNLIKNINTIYDKNKELTDEYNIMKTNYYDLAIEKLLKDKDEFVIFDSVSNSKDLKNISAKIAKQDYNVSALIQAKNHDNYQFVLVKSSTSDLDIVKVFNQLKNDFDIRGGGKGQSISGKSDIDVSKIIKNYL